MAPPLALKAADALVAWQVYQPALVIGEFAGPLALGEAGKPASFLAHWRLAQASVRASLAGAERVSIVCEAPDASIASTARQRRRVQGRPRRAPRPQSRGLPSRQSGGRSGAAAGRRFRAGAAPDPGASRSMPTSPACSAGWAMSRPSRGRYCSSNGRRAAAACRSARRACSRATSSRSAKARSASRRAAASTARCR